MSETARVGADHLVVPSTADEPLVVEFDGRYVWSFLPTRDGTRSAAGRRIAWPEVLLPRLDGTTVVSVRHAVTGETVWEEKHSFRDNPDPLLLVDKEGRALCVGRAGHLGRAFSEAGDQRRRHIAEGTAQALADLRERAGLDAHLSYGSLLGAVRTGRMIGHDSDTDLAYYSRHRHPADVAAESLRAERVLRGCGWKLVRMSGGDLKLFWPNGDGTQTQVDVFAAFHVEDTFYELGARSGDLPSRALTPARPVSLEGVEMPGPADPEAVLSFLYGPGWRVPDPSFQNVDPAPGVRRLDGWLRGPRTGLAEWNSLFRQRRGELPRPESTFAQRTRSRIAAGSTVVEIGCGRGRDAGWFAGEGHPVIACDYSAAALRMTFHRLQRAGVAHPDIRVLLLGDVRSVLLLGAELARLPEAPQLYARGLVGCLDEEARDGLWRLSSMALRRGGRLHLEYASEDPAGSRGRRRRLPEVTTEGRVRRLSTAVLIREIEASGGTVVAVDHEPGQDLFDRPDPCVARLEARWDIRPSTPSTTARALGTGTAGGAMTRDTVSENHHGEPGRWDRVRDLWSRYRDLEASVQENRRLNRRVAELTDAMAELVVPLAQRDEARSAEALEHFRATTFGPGYTPKPPAEPGQPD